MKTLKIISPDQFQVLSKLSPKALPSHKERVEHLIAWSDKTKDATVEIVSSEFEFLGTPYSHYLVSLDFSDGRTYVGHGRSTDAHMALLKAYSEALERWAMVTYFKQPAAVAPAMQTLWREDGQFSAANFAVRFAPSARMHNSNGWAVDSHVGQAASRALREAIERHILQLNYWTKGLSFLKTLRTEKYLDYTIECGQVETGIRGLTTIVASFSRPDVPGKLFGHSTVSSVNGDSWIHPMIEGFQIAEASRTISSNDTPDNVFDEIQRAFWLQGNFSSASLPLDIKPRDSLNVNLVGIDLAATLSIPFPLFATWTFSDDLMPLFLERDLADEDKNVFSAQFQAITGASLKLFQTPFI